MLLRNVPGGSAMIVVLLLVLSLLLPADGALAAAKPAPTDLVTLELRDEVAQRHALEREAHMDRNVDLLMSLFPTQRSKRWLRRDLLASVMRLRGMEAGLTDGFAEGFYARKLVLQGSAI